jgi:hypothetical protein
MKLFFTVIITLLVIVSACHKTNHAASAPDLASTYKWLSYQSNVGISSSTVVPGDDAVLLVLNKDNTFVTDQAGITLSRGQYNFDTVSFSSQPYNAPGPADTFLNISDHAYLKSDHSVELFAKGQVHFSHDTLFLSPGIILPSGTGLFTFLKQPS